MSSPLSNPYAARGTANVDSRLEHEIARAAARRDRHDQPDIAALRVEKIRRLVNVVIWAGMTIAMLFTMANVQQFAAQDIVSYGIEWWFSWLLDPCICLLLLGVLATEAMASPEVDEDGNPIRVAPRTRLFKWALLAATYGANTWESWAHGSAHGVWLHSMPVLAVVAGAEMVTDCQEVLTRVITAVALRYRQRQEEKARKQAAKELQAKRDAEIEQEQHAANLLGVWNQNQPSSPVAEAVGPAIGPAVAPAFPAAVSTGGSATRTAAVATGAVTAAETTPATAVAATGSTGLTTAAATTPRPRSATTRKPVAKTTNNRGRERTFDPDVVMPHARRIWRENPGIGSRALATALAEALGVDVPRNWGIKALDKLKEQPLHAVKTATGGD